MIATMYQQLAARIATVQEIKRVTLYNEQVIDRENHYEAALPMALVEFTSIQWDDASRGVQKGQATVSVIVASNHIGDFIDGSHTQQLALASLRLLDAVHLVLQGWGGDCFGPLSRTGTEVDHRHDSIIAHTLVYRCAVTDASTDTQAQMVQVWPDIKVKGEVDLTYPPDASSD